jgi:hypothetical protein
MDNPNYDPLTVSVLTSAVGGAKRALTRETGYRALDAGERDADGDTASAQLSTPGSVWKITVERERSS